MGANILLSVILGLTLQSHVPNAVQTGHVVSAPTTKQQLETLVNVKTLAMATMMFGADNNDVMPKASDTKGVFAKIKPYLKSLDSTKSLNPKSSVLFNFAVNGVRGANVKLPAQTVLFYESKGWANGRRAVAFCDGHAKLISAMEWAKISKDVRGKP